MLTATATPVLMALPWERNVYLPGNANSLTLRKWRGGSLRSVMLLYFDIFTSVLLQRCKSVGTWLLAILFLLLLDVRLGIFWKIRSRVGSLITGLEGNS